MHKGKWQDEGHAGEDTEVTENLSAGMNNLGQGLSTELGDVKEEIRNINAKTYQRKAGAEGPRDSSAFKVRRSSRSSRLAAMAVALQDDARYVDASAATPAALHTTLDELQAAMLLSSMYRCSPSLPRSTSL